MGESKNQMQIAIDMISEAQKELGYNFELSHFEELIQQCDSTPSLSSPTIQSIIMKMVTIE